MVLVYRREIVRFLFVKYLEIINFEFYNFCACAKFSLFKISNVLVGQFTSSAPIAVPSPLILAVNLMICQKCRVQHLGGGHVTEHMSKLD